MIDRQHNKIIIACDSCEETFEGEPGDKFAHVWGAAKRDGWRTRKIADERLHGCPRCGVPHMRRPRPYIPLSVRVQVAERQLSQEVSAGRFPEWRWHAYSVASAGVAASINLARLIEYLSEALGGVLQLDHDPALILRQYKVDRRKPPAAWYTPNANDPDHLIYRPLSEHGEKTFGRKAGAEKTVTTKGSDIWLKTKFRRLESPSKKPRAKIPSRPFGKGRPFPKRRGAK